jgi:hypothetical protein
MGCVQVCPTGVIPNDFTVSSILQQKEALVFPVRMRDDDNARRVDEFVGNIERKKKS